MSECDYCTHAPTLGENVKRHKYLLHDILGHGWDQCYYKSIKFEKCKPLEF